MHAFSSLVNEVDKSAHEAVHNIFIFVDVTDFESVIEENMRWGK